MMCDVPPVVAHRGYALRYPENTLIALEAAIEAGARFIEFDVQLTSDCVPVLLHDADLRRVAGDERAIAALSHDQFPGIDVGERGRFGDAFHATPIATLAQVVKMIEANPGVTAFIELKHQSIMRIGAERMVEVVLQAMQPVREQCVIISFDANAIHIAKETGAPSIGLVLESCDDVQIDRARSLTCDWVFCDRNCLPSTGDLSAECGKWVIYEVTDPAEARAFFARGASLIETMAVREMIAALAPTRDHRK